MHSNYGSILHHFHHLRDIGRNRDFFVPPCIRRPRYGVCRRNIAILFSVEKLEWWSYPMVK